MSITRKLLFLLAFFAFTFSLPSKGQPDNYLNIKNFGAKEDGVTDDTGALVAAMEEASKSEGTIYFPTGEYMIHPVKVPSHITLLGHSAWAYANKDKKDDQYDGRTKLVALSGNARALLDMGSERGIRVVGLTLDGKRLGENIV